MLTKISRLLQSSDSEGLSPAAILDRLQPEEELFKMVPLRPLAVLQTLLTARAAHPCPAHTSKMHSAVQQIAIHHARVQVKVQAVLDALSSAAEVGVEAARDLGAISCEGHFPREGDRQALRPAAAIRLRSVSRTCGSHLAHFEAKRRWPAGAGSVAIPYNLGWRILPNSVLSELCVCCEYFSSSGMGRQGP